MTLPTRALVCRPITTSSESDRASPISPRRLRNWPTAEHLVIGSALLLMVDLVIGVLFVVLCGLVAAGRRLLRRKRRRRRREEVESELPDALSLMHVAVVAGAGPRQALLSLDQALNGRPSAGEPISDFRRQLLAVGRALHLGFGIQDAFATAFEQRIEYVNRISALLVRSERDGQALADGLHRLSIELRRRSMVTLDARAQRATVSLLFPLVFCILPAFLLLVVVPVIITVFDGLQPIALSR